MEYRNKLVLAPMVRVGTLPFRLLAAQYGADITYCEEIIDHKMLKCERRINEVIGSTDFVEKGTNNVVFRTCDEEKDRVVFQIGTSDAVRALTTAQLVCNDVAAVDINMGCPKSFSVSGGMGAALLSKPELIHDRNLNTPVTCKIRLLKSPHDTVELARRIEKTGVSALAVHGRKVPDRPRDPAKWNEIADVVSALSIPVIENGDVFENDDVERIKSATGASSVMVARGALWNASMFSPEGKVSYEAVKREYIRKCILWDNDIKSTKHTLKEMIIHYSCLELPEGKAVIKSESMADLALVKAISIQLNLIFPPPSSRLKPKSLNSHSHVVHQTLNSIKVYNVTCTILSYYLALWYWVLPCMKDSGLASRKTKVYLDQIYENIY
ncbi:tRNA-dihydrouridine(20) synthase [NAD(P)+]-like isoform X2 [Glycine soja]|uniref:tRNA-dihydrouridine(20) synthase [NAD(P)+]-like isoform X2 n=2 Tax=Glycine soja TaxID=3848 RepID=UPI00103B7C8C|nr:tRNA-dihydrouridine(20) synthase [NAD(P)+]-like isoform X2 [Glycine soja]